MINVVAGLVLPFFIILQIYLFFLPFGGIGRKPTLRSTSSVG